ncbi:MAG TPA: patatin-like phospholipase family protein [Vicinamibacterales bacterium]|nr:patatin-like phospholipase family protein [Vicinamibacterales bacterium]
MSELYSPERRTALVLTGTGADGVYHAGVLRALHEAGIKIDLACGRGIGAVGAVFAAVDGGIRLWDAKGLWRAPAVPHLYRWRWPLRVVFGLLVAVVGVLISPLLFLAIGVFIYLAGLLLGMAGLEAGASLAAQYAQLLAAAFSPGALPTWLPRLIALAVIISTVVLAVGTALASGAARHRRRSRGSGAWSLAAAPVDASGAIHHFVTGVWELLKGGANLRPPAAEDLSRRYSELLNENLAQPGFSELLIVAHDLDARRDVIFGLVREPFRRALFPPPGAAGVRRAEAFDLAGLARDHLIDALAAASSVADMTEPVVVRFAPDGYWRGEAHRLVDRPASLGRLLEEAAAAGAEQVILVSASPEPPGPHELGRPRLEPMARLSEHAASFESAALRDAVQHVQHRFRSIYQIRPVHNPVGAFDLSGAFDERSDREHSLGELLERGYQDAYHQFIEPVVAASGEHLRSSQSVGGASSA